MIYVAVHLGINISVKIMFKRSEQTLNLKHVHTTCFIFHAFIDKSCWESRSNVIVAQKSLTVKFQSKT